MATAPMGLAGRPPGVSLDAAPPMPPGATSKAPSKPGLGSDSGNPQILALQFTQQLVQSAQGLGSILPSLAQPMMQLVQMIEQLVPQAMADLTPGGQPAAPPGVMPPMGPPPGAGGPPPMGGGG